MEDDVRINPDELASINNLTNHGEAQDITTEIQSKAVEDLISVQVDKEKQEEFTLMHNFEKIETIEEFDDIWRDFDGDDSLDEDMNALNDINLKHTVKSG